MFAREAVSFCDLVQVGDDVVADWNSFAAAPGDELLVVDAEEHLGARGVIPCARVQTRYRAWLEAAVRVRFSAVNELSERLL